MSAPQSCVVGVGLYTPAEAARLLRIPVSKLRRWAEGYTFRCQDHHHFSEPVISRQLEDEHMGGVLSFLDLMELHFVSMFRRSGVSMPVIRAAAARGAALFQTRHPFAVRRFSTDGRRIFATLEQDPPSGVAAGRLMEELHASQLVFVNMVRPFLRKLDIGGDEIVRYWPLGKDRCVVLDPRRALGKPIDHDSGVHTFALHQASSSGRSPREIASWYDVTERAVRDAIEFEASLLALLAA